MGERHHRASQAIDAQRHGLSQAIVARQYELQGELWKPFGSLGREKSVRDAGYHLIYLSEALATTNPALFTDYVAWVKVLFVGLEFPNDVLVTTLECTRDALHELGVRMVADSFEMEGWDTYYVGANTPAESILQTIVERQPDILGVSATMTFHLRDVAALIARVRAVPGGRDAAVLVGGYPFNVAPDLWRAVGADGHARDAQEAVGLATRLLETGA